MRQKIPFRLQTYLPRLGMSLLAILTFTGLTAFLWTNLPTKAITTTLQQPTPIWDIEDTTRIKLEDIVLYRNDGEMFFDTNKTKKLHGFTGDSIIHYYGYLFDVGEHNDLRLERKTNIDKVHYGTSQTFFYELYSKGYPTTVVCASFDHTNGILASGSFRSLHLDLDTSTQISKQQAVEYAIQYYRPKLKKGELFSWESPSTTILKKMLLKTGDSTEYSFYPEVIGRNIMPNKDKYCLAYKVPIGIYPGTSGVFIWVDPRNGDIVRVG